MKNFESLFAAYLVVWAIFFVYNFSVARRLAELREELKSLKAAVLQGSESGANKR